MSAALLEAANGYIAAGLSVIPIADRQHKRPDIAWSIYQRQRPSAHVVASWFGATAGYGALAIPCGHASGGLTVIDFDSHNGTLYEEYAAAVEEILPGIIGYLPLVRTQSGGYHLYLLCDECDGNDKLAQSADYRSTDRQTGEITTRRDTWIETRGTGGYVLAPPTPGYTLVRGSLDAIPRLMPAHRQLLLRLARAFDDTAPTAPPVQAAERADDTERPGTRYNRQTTAQALARLLVAHGWTVAHQRRNGDVLLTRPGKSVREGISATIRDWRGVPVLYVFSTSATPFVGGKGYSPFQVLALLEHNGDFSAAARALGDGKSNLIRLVQKDDDSWEYETGTAAPAPQAEEAPATERPYFTVLTGAELRTLPKPRQLVEGWILEAPTAMIFAKAGVGKTFLALDMALCIASGRSWHGHNVLLGDILYIAAEGGYGIGPRYVSWCETYNEGRDVPGFFAITQPIYPTMPETLAALEETVSRYNMQGIRVIFVDTLAQCFGDGDENSTKDTQAFMLAINAVARKFGVTVVVIHHSGWNEERMRGASNLRAAFDSILQLVSGEDDHQFTVKSDKIKDLEKPQPVAFERMACLDSCYIRPLVSPQSHDSLTLSHAQREVLEALATSTLAGATSAELMAATGAKRATFFRLLKELGTAQLITSTGEKGQSSRHHTITERGKKALSSGLYIPNPTVSITTVPSPIEDGF